MNMQRRQLIAGGMSLLGAPRLVHAQRAATVRRVAILGFASEVAGARTRTAFKQGMHDLGWMEGKNVTYEIVHAEGDVNRRDALARQLVEQTFDVIVIGASLPTRTVQSHDDDSDRDGRGRPERDCDLYGPRRAPTATTCRWPFLPILSRSRRSGSKWTENGEAGGRINRHDDNSRRQRERLVSRRSLPASGGPTCARRGIRRTGRLATFSHSESCQRQSPHLEKFGSSLRPRA
jgi:hypothetical protein